MDIDAWGEAPAAVAVVPVERSGSALTALLAELDPAAVGVLLWGAGLTPAREAESFDIIQRAGFTSKPCLDGARLAAGLVYGVPADRKVWFESSCLRVSTRLARQRPSLERLLQSLARVWGSRSIVLASEPLGADAERGMLAVRRAGGLVRVAHSSDSACASLSSRRWESILESAAPASRSGVGSPTRLLPPFRCPPLFPCSPSVLARLRAASALAVQRAAARDRVRVWVPACKTGGFVYAVAMLLCEAIAEAGSGHRLQVFGTDPDEEALTVARTGRYPSRTAAGVGARLRELYLREESDGNAAVFCVVEALREVCFFSSHKPPRPAPFSRLDLIVCQRVFEGVAPSRRDDVVSELCNALREGGVLFALDHVQHFENGCFELAPEGHLQPEMASARVRESVAQRASPPPVSTPRLDLVVQRLELEAEIDRVVAAAPDCLALGRGLLPVLQTVLAPHALEVWCATHEPVRAWQRHFPELAPPTAIPPWPAELFERDGLLHRASPHAEGPGELWLPVPCGAGLTAVLRATGVNLRAPSSELAAGLRASARRLAPFFERLRAQREARSSEAERRRTCAELETLCASLPVGISIHDRSGAVRHGPPLGSDPCLARLYAEELPAWIKRVIDSAEPIHELELHVDGDAGHSSWLCSIRPLYDGGVASGAIAVVQDTASSNRISATTRAMHPGPRSSVELRRWRVLIIADDAAEDDAVGALLDPGQFSVERTSRLDATLRRELCPDFVLCDIDSPAIDLIALSEQLRATNGTAEPALIALTRDSGALTRLRLEQAGFHDHLTRPIKHDALQRCLSRLCAAPAFRHQR